MIRSSHAAPDTLDRAPDWRDFAACKGADDLMFPDSHPGRIASAKRLCAICPVTDWCLQWALERGVEYGVWGGLSEGERRKLRRRTARNTTASTTPVTLAEKWQAHTQALDGGHLAWTGGKTLIHQTVTYTPRQIAYFLDRGEKPYGQVLTMCEVGGCVRPDHLADAQERALMHGSRPGYRRHLAAGEEPCDDCRQANADADNLLRRTGTTKAAA